MTKNNYMGKIDEDYSGTKIPNYDTPEPKVTKYKTQQEVGKEFDEFMLDEYGKWKIGKIEAKNFIHSLRSQDQLYWQEAMKRMVEGLRKPRKDFDGVATGWMQYYNQALTDVIEKLTH